MVDDENAPEALPHRVAALRFYLAVWSFPLGLPFVYGLLFQVTTLAFFLSICLLLIVPGVFVTLLYQAIKSGRQRLGRRALAAALAALYIPAEIFFSSLWQPLYLPGVYTGLLPFYWHYERLVAALPKDGKPRLLVVDLESGILGHALIYDESDRLPLRGDAGLPPGWAQAWDIEPCDSSIHLMSHYYACFYHNEL